MTKQFIDFPNIEFILLDEKRPDEFFEIRITGKNNKVLVISPDGYGDAHMWGIWLAVDVVDAVESDKPVRCIKEYFECRDYLQKKYNYNENDPDSDDGDFWEFVQDMGEVYNGAHFTISDRWLDGAEPWQVKILEYYLSEFGEKDKDGVRTISMHASW